MSDSSGQASNCDVVTNAVKSRLSDLWKEEDYWAIWLGTLVLVIGLVVFFNNAPEGMESRITAANATMLAEEDRAPFKTVAWYQAEADKNKLKALNSKTGQYLQTPGQV